MNEGGGADNDYLGPTFYEDFIGATSKSITFFVLEISSFVIRCVR